MQINIQKNSTMIRKIIILLLMILGTVAYLQAQDTERTHPYWWMGLSGAANINMYTGTTQTLNSQLMAPAAFHEGSGIRSFGSFLLEYRPNTLMGFMLNLGLDNRGGSFEQVYSPCNCPEDLKTNLSYLTLQPAIRINPFGNGMHLFFGVAYSFNTDKSFLYTFDQNNGDLFNTTAGEFSAIRQGLFSSHVGLGYDIPVSPINSRTQLALSPFVSYHPYFGQAPRTIESWSLSTIRIGMALKIGTAPRSAMETTTSPIAEKKHILATMPDQAPAKAAVAEAAKDRPAVKGNVEYIPRIPTAIAVKRTINESFPIRNYIFFEKESSEIPARYVQLNKTKAAAFKSEQLRTTEPKNQEGRSQRQMHVYYNILNILGDRMRENPSATITLIGASAGNGASLGKSYAETVKNYLVDVFVIDASRIRTEGRDRPVHPSELPGGVSYLALLREADRRVDIVSSHPAILTPLQIFVVEADPNKKQEATVAEGKEALRYSILFDFDESQTVETYTSFINQKIVPNIPDNSTVIIHGHTDNIGASTYNMKLSQQRAEAVRKIIEDGVLAAGRTNVKFDLFAFGQDDVYSPFENKLPEERFYNRTVIIDIIRN
jgi:outer membrane protein OmpA-like peptidoglycan-associated protein